MRAFLELMRPGPDEVILDVGGSPQIWQEVGYAGPIVFLNLRHPDPPPATRDSWSYVVGNGRALHYRDDEFPLVFSNSVIEHVDDVNAFAREIRRVGRRYWVQTPSRHFPIEPHVNFPFLQYLPPGIAVAVAKRWPLSHHRGLGRIEERVRSVRLLSSDELRALFPDGTLWREKVFGLTKSIVVYRA